MSEEKKDPSAFVSQSETEQAAADVEAVMRKFDRESNTRVWEGTPKIIVGVVLVAFSLFCLYVTLFANLMAQVRMTSFIRSWSPEAKL